MGKTGTALNEFLMAEGAGQVNLMLVVCPNGLRENWSAEAFKMGFPYPVAIYPEPTPKKGVLIINYEKIIGDPFDDIEKIIRKNKVYAVCDESHRVKNHKAKVSKAITYLFDFAVIKRVMTGTPVANNIVDLWSQLRIIGRNGPHRTPYTFRNRYGVMGGFMGKQIIGTQREDELRQILDECSFTAKKIDWMSTLPPKVYHSIHYEMSGAQKKAYERIYKDRFLEVDGKEVTAQMVITALMKMQQITSGFMIDDDGEVINLCPKRNPKIEAVCDALEDVNGKVIVFAHYKHTINMLEDRLSRISHVVTIRGGMDRSEIVNVVSAFNNDDRIGILLAQTATAKEGLTLLGTSSQPCHTTVFVENTYSIIDRTQAEDRNNRNGQTSGQVTYYDMVGSPLESTIIKALQDKKDLIEVIRRRNDGG